MSASKEIVSIYSKNEAATSLLLNILLSNHSYTEELQKMVEDIAKRTEVTFDE